MDTVLKTPIDIRTRVSILAEIYAAINFCRSHPPRTPGDLHRKFAPTLGFCILIFVRGRGFLGLGPEGRAFIYERLLSMNDFGV